jgi:ABC-type sugar transport system permease subunit
MSLTVENILSLILAVLAAWQTVEVIHHGSIFASFRAYMQVINNNFLRKLFSCPFCMSVWAGIFWGAVFLNADLCVFTKLLGYFGVGLGISRMSNVLNDLTYKFSRLHNDQF